MKRCMLGALLLAVLLTVSLWAEKYGEAGAGEVSRLAGQAAQAALSGDWQQTAALARRAGAAWQKTRNFQALLHHREPVQNVDVLFSQLGAYEHSRDGEACGVILLSLQTRTGFLAGLC